MHLKDKKGQTIVMQCLKKPLSFLSHLTSMLERTQLLPFSSGGGKELACEYSRLSSLPATEGRFDM